MEKYRHILEHLPFITLLASPVKGLDPRPHLNIPRIIEAVVIAIIVGGFMFYITLPKMIAVMEEKISALKEADARIENKVDKITDAMVQGYLRKK